MPHEPKRRHSRERKGERRASITLAVAKTVMCSNCNEPMIPHKVCKYCGFYKGRQIVQKKQKNTSHEKSA
ncbi:MAG TPA: 50S ribosomal protein L32 [Patescibacteria group bacterium]|nr:50S ribosomal protein L32 [Patescibacteria group bacterium]